MIRPVPSAGAVGRGIGLMDAAIWRNRRISTAEKGSYGRPFRRINARRQAAPARRNPRCVHGGRATSPPASDTTACGGLALVGCGDDDGTDAGAVAAERAAAAAEEAAAAAVAAGEARAAESEAAAAVAAEAANAAADAAAALAAEAAESEDAANAAAAAEAAAAAAADAAAAASAAGDQAAAAVAAAASEAAEAAAQAARDAAAAVEAGTATAEAAQAAIDAAAEAAAAAGQAAATAQETAASAEAVAEAAAETAAAAVMAAEEAADAASEAADAAQEAAETAAMATAEPEGPAAGSTDLNATVRAGIAQAAGGTDIGGPGGGNGPQTWMHYDQCMQYDQFSRELVANMGAFEWAADDYTEAVFNVKPGQRFHDGAPVTAADVKFSYDRISGIAPYNPDGKFDARATYVTAAVQGEITVVDERTVHFPMRADASAFGLMGTGGLVVPKHIVEEIGDQAYNIFSVASGPFKLVSYGADDQVTSVRYEDYHVEAGSTTRQHKPYIKKMQQIVRPEPISRVAALEADEIDLAMALPVDLAENFLDSDDFNVLYSPWADNWQMFFNTLRPLADGSTPFQDLRVRRAINHAVNIDAIIGSLTGKEERNYGVPSGAFGSLTDEQKAELTYEYNPDKARALLAEAGYADGFHTPMWVHKGTYAGTEEAGLAVAQDLEKIGITSDFQADVHAVFRPRLGSIGDDGIHEAPGMHFYFANHNPDPASFINAEVSAGGSIAMGQVPDSNIQELVDAQKNEFDPAERAKKINELAVAVYEQAIFLFLIEPVSTGVMRKNLEWINYGTRRDHFNYWGIRSMVT